VLCELLRIESLTAMLAILFGMEILIVFIEIVYIDHFLTLLTTLNVSAAIGEMTVDFRLWEVFTTILALFEWLHKKSKIFDSIIRCPLIIAYKSIYDGLLLC
jgi:hypothetical protein